MITLTSYSLRNIQIFRCLAKMDGCWLNLELHGFNAGIAINKQTHHCFFRHFISIRDKDVTKIMLVILKLRRKKMRPTVRPKEL